MASTSPSTYHVTTVLPTEVSDAATVNLALTPSGPEVGGAILDTATALVTLTPSVVYSDAQTEALKLTPSGLDLFPNITYFDSGTELFKLTPSTNEHYCPQKVEFEGDLYSRWTAEKGSRWKASNQSRWEGDFLGVGEGLSC